MDLHDALFHNVEWALKNSKSIAFELDKCATNMARLSMISYDIKSANIVVRLNPFEIRFIDFGYDYCEYHPLGSAESKKGKPVLSWLSNAVKDKPHAKKMYEFVIRMTILVLLSANLQYEIYQRRKRDNLNFQQRCLMNPLYEYMFIMRQETPAFIVRLIKGMIRHKNVHEVTEHYNTRRNSNVRRTFILANFVRPSDKKETSFM